MGLFSLQFLLYGGIYLSIRDRKRLAGWLFALALGCRAALLFTQPTLENDFWRYLWDGRVLANGINPYQYKPLDPALDHLDVPYRKDIGWKEYGTIYPPVSIAVFALSHLMYPDSLIVLKVLLTLFDVLTGAIIFYWLLLLGRSPNLSLLYFLNPLVLKEIANSAHLDSIAVFFTTLSTFLLWKGLREAKRATVTFAWTALALAACSKLFAFSLLPLFLVLDNRRTRNLIIFALTSGLIAAPFLGAGIHMLNGGEAFARYWIFNASLYRIFESVAFITLTGPTVATLNLPEAAVEWLLHDDRLAKILSGAAFISFLIWRSLKIKDHRQIPSESLFAIGALLLLSPVTNGWYLLWLLPFAFLTLSVPWIAFSYLIAAAYAWWWSQEFAPYFRWAEYLIFFGLLFYWHMRTRLKNAEKNEDLA